MHTYRMKTNAVDVTFKHDDWIQVFRMCHALYKQSGDVMLWEDGETLDWMDIGT